MSINQIRSFLEESYGFRGYTLDTFRDEGESLTLHLKRIGREAKCPECGRINNAEELRKRRIRGLDFVKPFYIEFKQAKIRCACGYRGNERVDFTDRHSRYTKRFLEYAAMLTKRIKIAGVAKMYDIEWKCVKNMKLDYYNLEEKDDGKEEDSE